MATPEMGDKHTITVAVRDLAGNFGSAATIVTVPYDQGR